MTESASPHSWVQYYQTCLSHPGAVRLVEQALNDRRGALISVREVTDALAGRGATYDQVAQVLSALSAAGALRGIAKDVFAVEPNPYAVTLAERAAVLDALSWASKAPDDRGECELLVATPANAASAIGDAYQTRFFDLRTALRTLVAEAKSRVVLAAPYWDLDVAIDFAELLGRRQRAGVRVAILAREPRPGSPNDHALSAIGAALSRSSGADIRILDSPSRTDPFGSSTFHFKAAAADNTRVYLGSANFNTAGLSSRWELGVHLGGARARCVADLLENLLAVARPFLS